MECPPGFQKPATVDMFQSRLGEATEEAVPFVPPRAHSLDGDSNPDHKSADGTIASSSSQEQSVSGALEDEALLDEGEVTVGNPPRVGQFAIWDEVFYRPSPYPPTHLEGFHCVIKSILLNAERPMYEVEEIELEQLKPDENGRLPVYLADATELIPISETGVGLVTFDVGTTVLVRFPDTTSVYLAEVVSYRAGIYAVRFQGDQAGRQTNVEKRFVVAEVGPPIPQEGFWPDKESPSLNSPLPSLEKYASRTGNNIMSSVNPSPTTHTDPRLGEPQISQLQQNAQNLKNSLRPHIILALQRPFLDISDPQQILLQQKLQSGWGAAVGAEQRAIQVRLLFDSLLLVKPIMGLPRALVVALSFEQKVFIQSISPEAYVIRVKEKLDQIYDTVRLQSTNGIPTHGLDQPLESGSRTGTAHFATQPHVADITGQIPAPGHEPRVTVTRWEDEGTLSYQVEANDVIVSRREDNDMINGAKLLDVAGLSRGDSEAILENEVTRHVVEFGPEHLTGVWIPYDRALELANEYNITESLYPLFIHDIGGLLYNPPDRASLHEQIDTPLAAYQQELMLLERKNKQRLIMERIAHEQAQATLSQEPMPEPET